MLKVVYLLKAYKLPIYIVILLPYFRLISSLYWAYIRLIFGLFLRVNSKQGKYINQKY